MTSGLTGRRYHWLSYGGMVRALGLEPSLVRGKSPVPYPSGVTRISETIDASAVVKVLPARMDFGLGFAGPEGVEPPAVGFGDRGATAGSSLGVLARVTVRAPGRRVRW